MAAKRVAPHDRVINEKRKTDLLAGNLQICFFLCTGNLPAEIHRSLEVPISLCDPRTESAQSNIDLFIGGIPLPLRW